MCIQFCILFVSSLLRFIFSQQNFLVWKTTTFFHVLAFLNLFPVFVLLGFTRFHFLSLHFIFLCSLLWVLVFFVLFWRYLVSAQVYHLCLISSGYHCYWDPVPQISLNLCFYLSCYHSLNYFFRFLSKPSCLYCQRFTNLDVYWRVLTW